VVKAEATGPREITFTFDEKNNKELPKIVGELIILPKHWWESESGEPRAIDETTLQPVLGSGPYRISNVRPGDSMTFERVEDYWGADLNVNVGQNNFDQIIYTYFGRPQCRVRGVQIRQCGFLAGKRGQAMGQCL
jgi:microcin C transport system substrate-binding protein